MRTPSLIVLAIASSQTKRLIDVSEIIETWKFPQHQTRRRGLFLIPALFRPTPVRSLRPRLFISVRGDGGCAFLPLSRNIPCFWDSGNMDVARTSFLPQKIKERKTLSCGTKRLTTRNIGWSDPIYDNKLYLRDHFMELVRSNINRFEATEG
jgi:hypothetical protein